MKKFADRKSLESTQFANLQDLVMRVITFALDSPRFATGNSTEAERAAEVERLAVGFCKQEDAQIAEAFRRRV
jgi:hypothetical protein